jgi:hypothetical protein
MSFTFPEDAHWNAESQVVEFAVIAPRPVGIVTAHWEAAVRMAMAPTLAAGIAAPGTGGSNPSPSTSESDVRTGDIGNGTYLRHG